MNLLWSLYRSIVIKGVASRKLTNGTRNTKPISLSSIWKERFNIRANIGSKKQVVTKLTVKVKSAKKHLQVLKKFLYVISSLGMLKKEFYYWMVEAWVYLGISINKNIAQTPIATPSIKKAVS